VEDIREELTDEEIIEARRIFKGEEPGKSGCWHCGGLHELVAGLPMQRQPCPRVKRALWHPDGTLLEVEYWERDSWEDEDTVYPSEVFGVALEGDAEIEA